VSQTRNTNHDINRNTNHDINRNTNHDINNSVVAYLFQMYLSMPRVNVNVCAYFNKIIWMIWLQSNIFYIDIYISRRTLS